MTADVDNTNGDAAGVIANHGGAAGGYAIYVKDGRLCYVDNFLGTETTIVRADVPLPRARVTVKCTFASTGTFGGGGDVELFHDDVAVGGGNVPRTVPISFGMLWRTNHPARCARRGCCLGSASSVPTS